MAEFVMDQSTSSATVVVQDEENDDQEVPVVRLTLRKPKTDKKVQWTTGTVDNENMNKKKSKCCCIYQKPRKLNESDSEDEGDECDNCKGHVERRKQKRLPDNSSSSDAEFPHDSLQTSQ